MGFGNFKQITLIAFLCFFSLSAQENILSSQIYEKLDLFLQHPSPDYSDALQEYLDQQVPHLKTPSEQLAWVIATCNLGYYQNRFQKHNEAIENYENAWQTFITQKLKNYDIVQNCLLPLGNLYLKIGDLTKAESTITSYLYEAERNKNQKQIISAITNLSVVYHNQSNYKKAIELLHKGIKIAPNNHNLWNNLASNYLETNNFIEAERIAKKLIKEASNPVNAYQILAKAAFLQQKFDQAEQLLEKAKVISASLPSTTSRDIAKLELAHVDILINAAAFKQAEKHIKKVYEILLPNFKIQNQFPNKEELIADQILLKTLDTHSSILQQLDKSTNALHALELGFKVNQLLVELYPLQNTKLIQHSQQRNLAESYINLLYNTFHNSSDTTWINKAFNIIEHTKASFVSEALISKQQLISYQKDSLVNTTEKLTQELSEIETKIIKEKLKGTDANIDQIQQWSTNYTATSINLKATTAKLEQKYPRLVPKKQELSIKKIQEKMISDKLNTVVSYFYGSQNVYQFMITPQSVVCNKIGTRTVIDQAVLPFIQLFDHPATINNNIALFSEKSHNAYTRLQLPEHSENIVILPDGLLGFIPFEALLTSPTKSLSFSKMPFLIQSSTLSYELSARQFLNSTSTLQKDISVLGVFPIFANSSLELPYSEEEYHTISTLTTGDFLTHEKATYSSFLNLANTHNVLHLSTHAESGDFSRPASIKFIDQDVLVTQLYGLHLNADLVVLSACETGVGKVVKGEGPLSIARGFQYAGIPNIVLSLWKVNDKSTAHLMNSFYANKKTLDREALHQSKIDYLKNTTISNPQKSPYHWASFVYYGNIDIEQTEIPWHYIIIGLCFLFALLLPKVLRRKVSRGKPTRN